MLRMCVVFRLMVLLWEQFHAVLSFVVYVYVVESDAFASARCVGAQYATVHRAVYDLVTQMYVVGHALLYVVALYVEVAV